MQDTNNYIPYGRQLILDEDIEAVVDVLKSDWLTTGPQVTEFENQVSSFVGVEHGVTVNSGTAALHAAMFALGVGAGDEVIVPTMTFAATANCVVYQGATPVFADISPESLLINPDDVLQKITDKTKAIIAVDYAGQPCEYDSLREVADLNNLFLVADGSHSLGGEYKGRKVGSLADITTFSFHPVKHITTGEGGMVVTDDQELASRMESFRNHGISSDHRQREDQGTWYYEMRDLGFNYRLSDINCALGINQLKRLPEWIHRRNSMAGLYDTFFAETPHVLPIAKLSNRLHAYHLYVVKVPVESRTKIFKKMRKANVGVNVHYIPVHLHPFYQEKYSTGPGLCPIAEEAYNQIISLPMHQGLSESDASYVVESLLQSLQ